MAEFVQIGEVAYRIDAIRQVDFRFADKVYLQIDNNPEEWIELIDQSAVAFRFWWENVANVYKAL